MSDQIVLGKKIFFLYPPPVLSEVAEELAKNEFEVYLVNDHRRLRALLAANGESILFVNIDKVPEGTHWETFVREILEDSSCRDVGVGVMTMNDINPENREKYVMQLQVPCGYVVLKLGTNQTIDILKRTLDANEAKGKRKHVRAKCPPGAGQCNVEIDGQMAYAEILDISSVGMAVSFEGGISLRAGTVLEKIAVHVRGTRLLVDGFVATQRPGEDGSLVSVVMFHPNSLDEQRINKLKILVYKLNQHTMDQLLLMAN
jgi:hypothetical protein